MNEAVKIAADVLSERARLKKGGECVRYAAIVIQALEDTGYRVVKQEQAGRAFAVTFDASEPEGVTEGWHLEGLDEEPIFGDEEVTHVPVWVDLP